MYNFDFKKSKGYILEVLSLGLVYFHTFIFPPKIWKDVFPFSSSEQITNFQSHSLWHNISGLVINNKNKRTQKDNIRFPSAAFLS